MSLSPRPIEASDVGSHVKSTPEWLAIVLYFLYFHCLLDRGQFIGVNSLLFLSVVKILRNTWCELGRDTRRFETSLPFLHLNMERLLDGIYTTGFVRP